MEFEVKFYRLHDLDIVGLRDLGYPVQAMLRKALIEYAALPMALTIEFSTQAIDEQVRIIITFLSVIICFTIAITESIKS